MPLRSSGASVPPTTPRGVETPRRPRRGRVAVAVLLVIAFAAGGFGLQRILRNSTSSASTAEGSFPSASGGSSSRGGVGLGNTGSAGNGAVGNSGNGNFGSGGPGIGNSGNSGTGNSGSGGAGTGNSGTGNSGTGNSGSGNFGGGFGGTSPFGNSGSGSSASTGSGAPSDVSAIAAKVDPAIVDIRSTFSYQSATGEGSGIVLTANGEVLTNNHVIEGATAISVTDVGTGKTYVARVVGYDRTHDIAVLQLDGASGLPVAKIGDSSKVAVGTPVVAIGNAGGVGGTPTAAGGSITALNRSITASNDLDGGSESLTGLISVSADVQAGDSGGPLVNAAGTVIGMDTAAASNFSFQSQASQGFSIPINTAISEAQAMVAGRGSSDIHIGATAFLGLLVSPAPLGFSSSPVAGVTVSSAVAGSPSARAGIGAGDTITAVDGVSVTTSTAMSAVLMRLHPGDNIMVKWSDPFGTSHSATVTLASGPPE